MLFLVPVSTQVMIIIVAHEITKQQACSPFAFGSMCIDDCCRGEVGRNNEIYSASLAGRAFILVFGG
jgi:hypothetical protein